jgi:oligopeptidase B
MTDTQRTPPVAAAIPTELEKHEHVRIDDYYWLNQRDNPEVIAYLEAENAYTDAEMAHTTGLQSALYEELRSRIKQKDMSVPYKRGDYYYYTRFEEGQEYPIHCRKRETMDAEEEVMLDVNEMARGHGFFNVGRYAVSARGDLLAYPVDAVGRRIFTIYIKDLSSGEMLDVIPDVTDNLAWAEDNRTLFYTRQDPVTLRWYQVFRHILGTEPEQDYLVYEEQDETFSCSVRKTKSRRYILIGCEQTLSTEYHYLDSEDPTSAFVTVLPRERDHEYHVDHCGDHFYIRTNDQAKNFRLVRTPVSQASRDDWEEVVAHRDDALLEGFELFRDHLVTLVRVRGLPQIAVRAWGDEKEHLVDFDEAAYVASVSDNYDLDVRVLRFTYSSMATPESVYDYNLDTHVKKLLKRQEILGGFDPVNYQVERLWATAKDGTEIPVSVVYRKGLERDGENPTLIYGYGSYGYSIDAAFDAERVSLLDRGFVFAIAHIRGGSELGRWWYEGGKLLHKVNTFTDFIACAEHLVRSGFSRPDKLFAMGRSAGGLLMGAVLNLRPDLFKGVIAGVPFVDVVTTMLDDSIPLTTSEYDEWGNPNDLTTYRYMLSYSPYDNVETMSYPNLLVMTSLHDSQVQYWEPAKWVAKLRAKNASENRLLLRTKMEAGHGGVSGRFKRYRETAFTYAFILDLVGIRE